MAPSRASTWTTQTSRRYDGAETRTNSIAREVIPVAGELGATAAQVAIRGLEIELTPDPFGRLAGVGDFRAGFPRNLESEDVRGFIFGDTFELIDDPRAPSRSPVATTA